MTQWPRVLLRLLFLALPILAQTAGDEDYHVYTDSPRILLNKQRLRLLQRERERQSMRWQQFDSLISGGAAMPEPGFALALYYRASQDAGIGKKAVEWALSGDAKDLRQLALVFDWCGPAMNQGQADRLAAKIQAAMAGPAKDDVQDRNARVLAAIAIADRLPDHGAAELHGAVETWWRGTVLPRIQAGQPAVPREGLYWLYEMLHAIRDNLKIDLRESAVAYFNQLPVDHLAGHYPAAYPAAENEYRVPIYARDGDPAIHDLVMARAVELAMVGYDANAIESQFMQGWLMQDRFLMRSGLGIGYEFLWANPYQPGLSYFHVPLVFHDPATGHVFARTSWDEDATWVGYFEGHLQLFADGRIQNLRPGAKTKPVRIGDALLIGAEAPEAARFTADAEAVFVLNLTPRATYDVEVDDEELWEEQTDAGGTLVLSFPEGINAGVRIKRR